MESKKEASSSSSSFTADLFGSKESSPSSPSPGIFASIFPPPNKVVGRKPSICVGAGSWENQGGNHKQAEKNDRKSIFVEERVEPCHLSSSLYYGGQDNYCQPPATTQPSSGSYPMLKKDGREDEDDPNGSNSNSACRGNWWQGSLYY